MWTFLGCLTFSNIRKIRFDFFARKHICNFVLMLARSYFLLAFLRFGRNATSVYVLRQIEEERLGRLTFRSPARKNSTERARVWNSIPGCIELFTSDRADLCLGNSYKWKCWFTLTAKQILFGNFRRKKNAFQARCPSLSPPKEKFLY